MNDNEESRLRLITRRQALALTSSGLASAALGAGAAATLATNAFGAEKPKPIRFKKGAIIRTLLRDMPPESLASGPLLFHEHLSMRYPPQATTHFTDDIDLMVAEVRAAGQAGIKCIVDGGHPDMDRSIDALKRIATESGVAIVASGGYYMQRTYPPEIATMSVQEITETLVREANEQRLGAFGEIGQQTGVMTDDEKKVFQAVAKAQVRTRLPIFTHNAYTGTRQVQTPIPIDTALRQLDVLEDAGAEPNHIAIGHVCCLDDPKANIARKIAKRGAYVGFDRVTIQGIIADEKRVAMVMALVDAGYAHRILIASDFSSGAALKQRGGPGIAQAWTVFGPLLLRAGLFGGTLTEIMVDNPRRFLAFVPPKSTAA